MTSSACPPAEDGRVVTFLRLIRFPHTLFALPYAVAGFVLGLREAPASGRGLAAIALPALVAIVCARTAAMTFNRLVDRRFDTTNPRTRERASVTGRVSPREMALATAVAGAGFAGSAFLLNPLCGWLSFAALAVILGYSYTKRVTSLSHFVLGGALGLAPIGAYLAATGEFGPGAGGVWLLSAAVLFWTAGFDILYACQDVGHDRSEGLFSIPARLGVARALVVARLSHALVPVFLLLAARALGLGPVFGCGIVAVAALLAWEHRLVRPDDLSRIQTAFFQLNVAISMVVMAAVALDLWLDW
jgi:4-hydroxybenzoate polyprenyltransferase